MGDKTFLDQMQLPTIKQLRCLAYKQIFESLSYKEEVILDKALKFYSIPDKDMTVSDMNDLISINQILMNNERGEYSEIKEEVKEFQLNYKDIYNLN